MTATIFTIDHSLSVRYRTAVITFSSSTSPLVKALFEDEQEWRRREGKNQKNEPFTFARLRPLHSKKLLQELMVGSKLHYQGKPLIGDFFTKVQLEYLAEPEGDGYRVSAYVLFQNKSIPCKECSLILQGAPHILIHSGFLAFFDPEVSWQELASFLQESPFMSKNEYAQFRKEFEHIRILEEKAQEDHVEPILQLVDGTLSFANLNSPLFEKDLFETGFVKKQVASANYYCPTDKAVAAVRLLLECGWKVIDSKGSELALLKDCALNVEEQGTKLSIQGKMRFGEQEVSLVTAAPYIKQKSRLLPLGDGKTGLLALDAHKEIASLFEEVEILSSSVQLPKYKLGMLADLPIQSSAIRELLQQQSKIKEVLPGTAFHGTLRPYQQHGVNWLSALFNAGLNGLLADEMGLGKTIQVLAFLAANNLRALIICPTSLLSNWQREAAQFLPNMRCTIYHGQEREHETLANYDLVITSYGTIRLDLEHLKQHTFDCLVLDESQAIKNSSTQTAQATFQLNSRFRISLTGTPVENSPAELVSQFRFLEPGLLDDSVNIAYLKKKIAPFILRRKKSDVAKDLPEKIEQTVAVPMLEAQASLYERFLQSLQKGLLQKVRLDGVDSHRMEIFEAILRLRQICCHPRLIAQIAESFDLLNAGSAKLDLVLEDIDTLISEGKKVVLFSQFTSMLDIIEHEVKKRAIPTLKLVGQTQNRQELVDHFQNDESYPLFLISLKAGGVGINLTRADYVLIYDPWWNRAQEEQAIDRAHRIGRKEAVFCKRYITENSIEEKIRILQDKKKAVTCALLDDDTEQLAFTLDDLTDLF